jgi:hypothetical protein
MNRSLSFVAPLLVAPLLVACGSKKAEPPADIAATSQPTEPPPADAAAPPAEDSAAPPTEPPPSEGLVETAPADVAAPPADAQKTASGLAYKVLKEGAGPDKPTAADTVKVFYVGWTTDGKMFDKQIPPEQPITFPLRGVIAGWTEGVQLMKQGDRFRFWIPKELAYNDRPGRPAGMLVFDVELLKIAR